VNDAALAASWTAVLLAGFGAVALLHRAGLPRTYARDLLHVGAGVWIVGWPWWKGALAPLLLVWTVFALAAALPIVMSRVRMLQKAHDSVAGEGERWAGIVAYAASMAALSTLALGLHQVAPSAFAVAALCAGDGLGGLVGRRFGRRRFRLPWSKAKTWEGTAAVFLFSALGIVLAQAALSLPVRWEAAALLGAVSAAAEAVAPRASDNVVVPAAVAVVALLLG